MTPITEKSIAIDGELFAERRGEIRHRVLKGGSLSFNNGYGALECVVRNLSGQGAKLAFGDVLAVPPRFSLRVSGEAAAREAQVCWRGETEVGVRLTQKQ